MSIWHRIKWIASLVGGVIAATWLTVVAYRNGKQKGRKEVLAEHESVIKKVEEKEEKKHAIRQETVVDDLNHLTGGKPK